MKTIKVNPYLFARWVVMHYGSDYLNRISGNEWKKLYKYYNEKVVPNYKINGSYQANKEFLKTPSIPKVEVIEVIREVPLKTIYVPYESNGCDCGQMSCPTCHG